MAPSATGTVLGHTNPHVDDAETIIKLLHRIHNNVEPEAESPMHQKHITPDAHQRMLDLLASDRPLEQFVKVKMRLEYFAPQHKLVITKRLSQHDSMTWHVLDALNVDIARLQNGSVPRPCSTIQSIHAGFADRITCALGGYMIPSGAILVGRERVPPVLLEVSYPQDFDIVKKKAHLLLPFHEGRISTLIGIDMDNTHITGLKGGRLSVWSYTAGCLKTIVDAVSFRNGDGSLANGAATAALRIPLVDIIAPNGYYRPDLADGGLPAQGVEISYADLAAMLADVHGDDSPDNELGE